MRFLPIILFGIAVLLPLSSMAAAWVLPKGKYEVLHNYFFYTASESFDSDGNTSKNKRFSKHEYNPFIQYGVREDLTLGVSPSIQYLTQDQTEFGLADAEVFLRKQLWKGNKGQVASVQPLIKLYGPYDEDASPALGQKQIDIELRGLYGAPFSLFEQWHFYNIEAGYRHRFESPGDEWRIDSTLGLRADENNLVLLQLFSVISVDKSANNQLALANSSDFTLHKLQASYVHTLDEKLSLQLGGFTHIAGENTGAGGGILFSVWTHF
jgi:hypothetical protein